MTLGWKTSTLAEVGHWLSGGTPSKLVAALWAGPVPWVSPKDMKRPRINDAIDHVAELAVGNGTQLAPIGSVLMVVRGMILAHTFPVALTTAPVTFNQDIKALVPASAWSAEFLLYWLQCKAPDVLKLVDVANHGTKRLPSERLFEMVVPLPPLSEQRKIAAILTSVDDAIETTQAVIHQLQVVKKAMMAELLTRGIPGRHTQFRMTEIGEVPEEWEVVRIGDVLTESAYGTSAKCATDGVGPPVLRIPNVVSGRVSLNDLKYASLPTAEVVPYRLRAGDLLVIRTNGNPNYVGRSAIVPHLDRELLYASYLIRLRVSPCRVTPEFLHEALRTEAVRKTMVGAIRTSAGNYNLNTQGIANTVVPLPSLEEQTRTTRIAQALEERIDAERNLLESLRATKSALMSTLLTGEVRVTPDAEAAE